MNPRKDYPGFWHAVLLCVTFVGLQAGVMIPFAVLGSVLKTNLVEHPAVLGVINLIACVVVLGMAWLIGRPPVSEVCALRAISLRAVAGVVVASAGALILLSEVDNLVRFVLPPPESIVRLFAELSFTSKHPWASLFALVIVAPATEELMFRGLILRGFLRRFGVARAFLLSAVLFGIVHLNPWQFFSATGLGLLFAWWYARTRSLVPSLIGHALVNGTFALHPLLPFEVRGFNAGEPFGGTEFQPMWFDALGALLLAAGAWLFRCATPFAMRDEPPAEPQIAPESGAPPIIGG